MDFVDYSDIGFHAFDRSLKQSEIVTRKKEVIDQVLQHYRVRAETVLFVGFKTTKANKSDDCYRTFYAPYLTTIHPNQPTTVLDNVDPKLFYQMTPDKPFLPCVFKYADLGIDRSYLDSLKKENKIFTFIFLLMQTVLKENAESGVPETLWRFILKNEQQFLNNPLSVASQYFTNYISAIPNPAWKILGK